MISRNSRRTAQIDKTAIEAMGDVLEGTNKPFIVTSGTGLIAPGVVVTEDMRREASPHVPRVSEQAGLAYASRGVRAMAIRLPQVHGGDGKAGLITYLLEHRASERRCRLCRRWRRTLGRGAPAGCGPPLPAGAGEGRGGRDLSRRRRGRRAHAPDHRSDRPRAECAGRFDQEGRSRRLLRPAGDVRRSRHAGIQRA